MAVAVAISEHPSVNRKISRSRRNSGVEREAFEATGVSLDSHGLGKAAEKSERLGCAELSVSGTRETGTTSSDLVVGRPRRRHEADATRLADEHPRGSERHCAGRMGSVAVVRFPPLGSYHVVFTLAERVETMVFSVSDGSALRTGPQGLESGTSFGHSEKTEWVQWINWWRRRESNPRPTALRLVALHA